MLARRGTADRRKEGARTAVGSEDGVNMNRAGYFGFYDAGKQVFFKDGGQNTSVFLKFGLALCVDISAAVFAYRTLKLLSHACRRPSH